MCVPVFKSGGNLIQNGFGFSGFEEGDLCALEEVIEGKCVLFLVQRHLVGCGPVALWVETVGEVVGGSEGPVACLVHEEGDVFDVIVLISCEDIECHAPEEFFRDACGEVELPKDEEGFFVRV